MQPLHRRDCFRGGGPGRPGWALKEEAAWWAWLRARGRRAAGLLSAILEGAQDFRVWSQKAAEFWNPQVLRCGINSRNCPMKVVPALIFGDGREGGGLKRVVVSLRTPPRPPLKAWGEEETHLHHQPQAERFSSFKKTRVCVPQNIPQDARKTLSAAPSIYPIPSRVPALLPPALFSFTSLLPGRFQRGSHGLANCKFTCHPECRSLIQLDCTQQDGASRDRPSPESTLAVTFSQNDCKPPEEPQRPPTLQEIKQKIESYNAREKNCLGMKLSEDGSYTGFIKVHLKLRRPVTVPAGIRPQSIYDAIKDVNPAAATDKRTSFYLPLDAVKQLHISSSTTVSEVIQGLLKKFMVVDNPQKFALFKRIHKDGQVLFQKLSIADCPLYLRLLAGPDTDVLSFVLKENETGEVEWDAFSIPELQNFLTILEKEEQDKVQQVQKKYNKFRQKLEEALRKSQGKPA
ncbi:ras association domain-containing protein 5-like [Bubalus kerabau]|uniref:ras association domain-containing protein 5-like n=1 Tax=Bubalus carabanensis TaxID=3119969 RepID=UPI00244EE1F2|nr:ras association domain-containing protein 5-like [Bubalus carabanensis]